MKNQTWGVVGTSQVGSQLLTGLGGIEVRVFLGGLGPELVESVLRQVAGAKTELSDTWLRLKGSDWTQPPIFLSRA